jgi:hypothetical protein
MEPGDTPEHPNNHSARNTFVPIGVLISGVPFRPDHRRNGQERLRAL